MKKGLFVCNSVYQILVASWIKYTYFQSDSFDVIVTDHMNGYESIAANLAETGLFDNVHIVNSKDYVHCDGERYSNFIEKAFYYRFPDKELKKYFVPDRKYDIVFFANYDTFARLLFDVLKRKNKNISLNIYEDGLASYSVLTKKYYNIQKPSASKLKAFVNKHVFNCQYMHGNIERLYIFNKDLSEWNPDCELFEIKKIDCRDEKFKSCINRVFDYQNLKDTYDEKYIFFEESFYAETGFTEDVELIEELAKRVGKDNLLIKIHPRNPENRFEKLGYKTNKDTAIPWEVIALNKDLTDKVLISISSTSILNPKSILDIDVRVVSIVKCLKNKPKLINDEFYNTLMSFCDYFDNIELADSIEEI